MSPDDQNEVKAQLIRIATKLSFQGPLPPPETLQRYNQIVPGAASRIISMAESQHGHRQHLEKRVVESNTDNQRLGLIFGFIIAMTAIVGGIYLAATGKSAAGLTAIVAALAALVGVFVYGKYEQRQELAEKREALEGKMAGENGPNTEQSSLFDQQH